MQTHRPFTLLLSWVLLLGPVVQAQTALGPKMSVEEARTFVERAKANNDRIEVLGELTYNRAEPPQRKTLHYSGVVAEVKADYFRLEEPSYCKSGETVRFDQVVAIKRRSKFAKAMKGAGEKVGCGAVLVAVSPILLLMWGQCRHGC